VKLLFVVQEYGVRPSGVVSVVRELCEKWDKNDQITLLINKRCQIDTGFCDNESSNKNVNIVRSKTATASDYQVRNVLLNIVTRPMKWFLNIFTLLYLIYWFNRERFDGVLSHIGGWPAGELNRLAIYAAWITGIHKRYLVIHNEPRTFPAPLNYFLRIYSRGMERICTRIITVSNSCRDSLLTNSGFNTIEVIYNGLSLKNNNGIVIDDGIPPWDKKYLTIGFVGEIHPRKGVHILIDALKHVETLCELVIVGNGYDEVYEKEIKQASDSLKHLVYYLGFRKDVQAIYKWIDILVLPSINYESFGMVIIEAMHNNIPIICSDFGGMKEVVSNYETGLVVKSGDIFSLSVAINKLLDDDALRKEYGNAGLIRVKHKFSLHNMLSGYYGLFHSI
jgi:teichuronic acid biosynthesis glycosyltransferase TuaC